MSIGRALDRLVDNAIIGFGDLANRFLNTYWPMEVDGRARFAAQALSDAEAERDCWEPDELYASQQRWMEARTASCGGVMRPFTDTDDFDEPVGEYPEIDPGTYIPRKSQP